MNDHKQHPVLYPVVTGLTVGVGYALTRDLVENYGAPVGYAGGVAASAAFAAAVALAVRYVLDRRSKPAK